MKKVIIDGDRNITGTTMEPSTSRFSAYMMLLLAYLDGALLDWFRSGDR